MQNVRTENRDGVLVVTIDRPKVLNALNAETVEEIYHAFASAYDDATVKAVILTGGGEKAFVAGADINELAQKTPITGKETSERGQFILDYIERFPKIVIAAINGFALGGGCEIALACHIRIASEKAHIGLRPRSTRAKALRAHSRPLRRACAAAADRKSSRPRV